jgi:hypothetical protein
MPGDRIPDSGNEHILYDDRGNTICEFGGFAGNVTKGECDISNVNYRKTLFPK